MQKMINSDVGRRAWNILRLALLWARKGGLFKRRLMMDHLNLFPKFLKSLGRSSGAGAGAIHYGERQFSFDKTPIIHVKMHRPNCSMRFRMPHIPCIKPHSDYDFEFSDDGADAISYCNDVEDRKSFLTMGEGEEEEEEDEGIDVRAEQFIAKFYEQMKLQRQISYLQYKESLRGGSC